MIRRSSIALAHVSGSISSVLNMTDNDPHHLLPVGTEELHLLKDFVGGVLDPDSRPLEMLTTAISISSCCLADANLNAAGHGC